MSGNAQILPRTNAAPGLLAPLVAPLINLMDERLRGIGYIRIDETPVQVIHSEKSGRKAIWSGALPLAVVAIPRGALTRTGLGEYMTPLDARDQSPSSHWFLR